MQGRSYQSGITLIEVIVAISIIASMVIAIGFSIITYVDARAALLTNTKTLYLAEEGYEILRALRDDDWNTIDTLTVDTYHYLDVATSTIGVTVTPEIIDGEYRRSFIVRDLYRDGTDDVTASTTSGATVDPDSREVEIFVASPLGTSSLHAILTNIHAE